LKIMLTDVSAVFRREGSSLPHPQINDQEFNIMWRLVIMVGLES
jgi:hypothetical protein